MTKNNMLTYIKNIKIKRIYKKKTLQEKDSKILLPSTLLQEQSIKYIVLIVSVAWCANLFSRKRTNRM